MNKAIAASPPSIEVTGVQLVSGGTLAQAAYRALRADILSGTRPPGERLRIEKLKSLYEVGPTPLREALQMLATDQLVIAEDNRGFTVAPLEPAEFADLNIARTAIELSALRLSIEHGDVEWEASVVAASYLMRKQDDALAQSTSGVPDVWEAANTGFHTAMVAACGSRWLLKLRASLHDQCARYRRASVYQKLGQRDLCAEHQAISQAVLARDADQACDLVTRHFALTAAGLTDASRHQAVGE